VQGFGTELGVANLVLYVFAAAVVAWIASRIRAKVNILLDTDLEKLVKRNRLMWTDYVKRHLEDSGNFTELLDLDGDD